MRRLNPPLLWLSATALAIALPSLATASHTLAGHVHETLTVAPTTWSWSEYVDGGRAPAVRTYPSGLQVVDVRDGVGALRSRSDAVGTQLQGADYDVYGQVSSALLGNGVQLAVARDVRGRVSARRYTRDGATVAEYRYTYDTSDRETLRQETHAGRRTSSWTYDDDGRLRSARVGGHPAAVEGAPPQSGGYTRSYDFGNIGPDTVRLTSSTGRAPVFASERSHVDVMGHAATIRVGTSTYTRTRDALGNTTRTWLPSGLADLSYDAQSHLRRVQLGDGTAVSYAYRADGVLLRRTVTCGPTVVGCEDGIWSYVYSGLLLLEEYSQASAAAPPALRVRYHYEDGSDVPLIADVRAAGTSTGAPTRYYLLTDRQGSVTGVLNASGAWVERVDYDPFGRPRYIAPDTAAPRVSRLETAGGRVRVEFSEVVQPESSPGSGGTLGVATLGAGLTVTVNGVSTSGVWRAPESSSDSTVWEYEVTSAVTAGDAVSLVVSSGSVVDEWSNPIGPATVSVTWGGAAYAGVAVGSTAAVESRRTLSGNNLSFQGHLYDAEAELILARARVLDPVMGEFLQRDPEGFVDSVNVYAALANDPINHRDPTGRIAWLVGALAVAGGLVVPHELEQPESQHLALDAVGGLSALFGGAPASTLRGLVWAGAKTGGAAALGMRATNDAYAGEVSSLGTYVSETAVGMGTGAVFSGALYGLGRGASATVRGFDRAVARSVVRADIRQVMQGLDAPSVVSRVGNRYLAARDQQLLYRGQNRPLAPGEDFMSPLARELGGPEGSANYLRQYAPHSSAEEIAGISARWHDAELPPVLFGDLGGTRVGGAGIPFTTRLATTLDPTFTGGSESVIYSVLIKRGSAVRPQGWPDLAIEQEFTILHTLSRRSILTTIDPRSL